MSAAKYRVMAILACIVLLLPILAGCKTLPALAADSYLAIVPSMLRANSVQAVSVALFNGTQPASGRVELSLVKDGRAVATGTQEIRNNGTVQITIPDIPEGDYTVRIKGDSFQDEGKVTIQNSYMLFLETDKPIYKPGQTIRIRALTLDPDLKPVSQPVTIDVQDAKGIKIYRANLTTDSFGMANADLPLSAEPNLGVWKLNGASGSAKAQLDVRVEEYVLPKYEVKVDLPREWFLVSEQVQGKITAEYSFGKPVTGEVQIKALKYVGQWQQYASITKQIENGSVDFTVPAAGYVAGVPAAGGQGNIQLDVTVVEKSTEYREKTSRLLTVAQSSVNAQIIPSSTIFKPGLPFRFLVVTQSPDKTLIDAKVTATISYLGQDFKEIKKETENLSTIKGKALVNIDPPAGADALTITCAVQGAATTKNIQAGYSPTGNFINIEQTGDGTAAVGAELAFKINATSEAATFYYEVVSRNRVLFSDYTKNREIKIRTTPDMAPTSRLIVYQILPNAEVAADYLPFKVEAQYPQKVTISTSASEVKPGDDVTINIGTNGEARVGLAAVDKSVFILAENRMNLQQVFDQLEKLYMQPQAELHEINFLESIDLAGAQDVFKNAGVVVLSSSQIPKGQQFKNTRNVGKALPPMMAPAGIPEGARIQAAAPVPSAAPAPSMAAAAGAGGAGLAEVQRVRQFFPETWLWQTLTTDAKGNGTVKTTAPDTITTWMLRAVAISKQSGLGVAEGQLKVFQPFFLSADLPYSAIRGEEFPVRVAVYNYLAGPQTVQVSIEKQGWFDLLDDSQKTLTINGNDIGGASFRIRPTGLGTQSVKVTIRSAQAADAVVKTLIVEPEGVAKEIVENIQLANGTQKLISTAIPKPAVPDSGRAYLALTASYLTQTVNGLDALLQMPFGCGEQNMIVFAPDVYITRYLQGSGQVKPEIMAKAEKLMITGYQRELIYRRTDGSFSAFGMQDKEGSIWLTGFVLKSFAEAKDMIFIDQAILDVAKNWIISKQAADGSFDQVGFVIHKEMMGGLTGKPAMTAYLAIALMQAGEKNASGKAVRYLEGQLDQMTDPYIVAITSYALELAGSPRAGAAYDKLMKLGKNDDSGLYWGGDQIAPVPAAKQAGPAIMPGPLPPPNRTASIETTAYAALALVKHGDILNAGRAAKWLVSKRNAYGGYGSTQDTVVALEALTAQATGAKSDVDLTVNVAAGGKTQNVRIKADNFDILQIIDLPVDEDVNIAVQGKGEAIAQVVRRFNVPEVPKSEDIIKIKVDYNTTEVAVNDLVKVAVNLTFNPPMNIEAGMIVADISVPTGFQAVKDSIDKALAGEKRIKRYDISGRKVIFYVENLLPGDSLSWNFNVQALYPVKAKGVTSTAYSYYKPELAGETLGKDVTVTDK